MPTRAVACGLVRRDPASGALPPSAPLIIDRQIGTLTSVANGGSAGITCPRRPGVTTCHR
ncbi:hypothetical protein AB0I54_11990 [Streptomyces sp. NPDC050625]|uniref:hypothetical protein n=1 Tax=Streptomyces sp. NPDC050625 TaxID=3154629 RepID=UPI0034445BF6